MHTPHPVFILERRISVVDGFKRKFVKYIFSRELKKKIFLVGWYFPIRYVLPQKNDKIQDLGLSSLSLSPFLCLFLSNSGRILKTFLLKIEAFYEVNTFVKKMFISKFPTRKVITDHSLSTTYRPANMKLFDFFVSSTIFPVLLKMHM